MIAERTPDRRHATMGAALALMGVLFFQALPAWSQEEPRTTPPAEVAAKRAGDSVPVPSRKSYVAPEYPPEAAAQGVRGIVIMEVLIGEDGRVLDAKVTRSIPGLDDAAIAAVRQWEYEPTKFEGKPVKVTLAQSITFALRLPELQRGPGIPELKSGGSPPAPRGLKAPASGSVAVTLGAQGEVREAAVLEGDAAVSEDLLRAVRSWRFTVSDGAAPPSFTVRAEWKPGPPASVTLSALDPKPGSILAADADAPVTSPAPAVERPVDTTLLPTEAAPAATQTATPAVETDVLTARPDPAPKEEGVSAVADVVLGDSLPDLVRGRRPIWPPMARLGNVFGDVVVRFSVDLAGRVTVHSAEGPDLLKASAEQAVGTWLFRRTAIDRLNMVATFRFRAERSSAKVERAQ